MTLKGEPAKHVWVHFPPSANTRTDSAAGYEPGKTSVSQTRPRAPRNPTILGPGWKSRISHEVGVMVSTNSSDAIAELREVWQTGFDAAIPCRIPAKT